MVTHLDGIAHIYLNEGLSTATKHTYFTEKQSFTSLQHYREPDNASVRVSLATICLSPGIEEHLSHNHQSFSCSCFTTCMSLVA